MLFSCRHCCLQSVLSLANQCIPLIIIMAFEYSLVKQSLHNISLTPRKKSNNDTCMIPKISLGINVIKFCFVDLGSPPLSLFVIGSMTKCHLMENASSVTCV